MTDRVQSHSPFGVEIDELERQRGDGACIIRLEAELPVTLDPLDAYAALTVSTTAAAADVRHRFLLESAAKAESSDPAGAYDPGRQAGDRARYSFVGFDPDGLLTIDSGRARFESLDTDPIGDPIIPSADESSGTLDGLRSALPDVPVLNSAVSDRHRLDGGIVGFLAYEAVYDLWLNESFERPSTTVPDAVFVTNTRTLVFDHVTDRVVIVLTPYLEPGTPVAEVITEAAELVDTIETDLEAAVGFVPGQFEVDTTEQGDRVDFESRVEEVRERIRNGEVYQTVIARSHELTGSVDTLGLYAALRQVNPSPYMYHLELGDRSVIGASPETLVTVRNERDRSTAVANPIAGTAPRGGDPTDGAPDPVEDRRLAGELLADGKERAEHTMLVDLARNDLRRVCAGGTVTVSEFMAVRKYSHVQHIESEVEGILEDADALDALRSVFPAGTLTGAPKHRAMELIHELEPGPRGVYGGGVGYVSWDGEADFAIAIRTATVEASDSIRLSASAGAGIVAESDPPAEFDETERKLGSLLSAIDRLQDASHSEAVSDV